jgi:hypothetical protein
MSDDADELLEGGKLGGVQGTPKMADTFAEGGRAGGIGLALAPGEDNSNFPTRPVRKARTSQEN